MPIHIALLRAINVGGKNLVAMSDLRDLVGDLGFTEAKTLLQSGNVLFQSKSRKGSDLEMLLQAETEKRLQISIDYFVRTAAEWETIIDRNPFREEAERDPGHLLVVLLKRAPEPTALEALRAAIKGPELVRSDGKQLYAVYPDGIGRSKLTNALIEQKLGSCGTGRNWNTVLKLGQMAQELAGGL
jgi:uncharacterized protein (DUF1697 family)